MSATSHDPIVIVGAARTPIGAFQGGLASLPAWRLGGMAIEAALSRAGVGRDTVSEVLMGCVLTAGQGQAPARQASVSAGLHHGVPCATINKMCGSGMKAAMLAFDALHARPEAVQVAGGMESMSNAPYLLPKARNGQRLGHGVMIDHMFLDGLEDAYDTGRLMGTFAEDTAASYGFTRDMQDAYALESLSRARKAQAEGAFDAEIAVVETGGSADPVSRDETPGKADPARIPKLRPAFRDSGTITAANSSSISDGAAALVMMRASEAERRGLNPLARVAGVSGHAQAPALFTTAPVAAINRLLELTQWSKNSVDLFEINEAFAVVAMAALRDLDLPHDKVNIHGGACALGHPIGASGARILVTLLAALQRYDLKRGIAAVCIGGGEATAMAVERMA
ncbi:acetyl-CoA acetyltransferase [Agaricicola taiwanensis]|uniref:Acetyl-CoA acetyltransferase n=1 Tax=Agaricicola taiwanensis TaxID=591372 RepID=A0A8J3DWK5_9RHOB|nr:acetyl-CoA C-acyltransferase [Agaricicola taiwanensis]GGE46585.1 acetyl-CoA acetyltransferase [Agaricicola taiwanensis]